jgi:hypothetical protein
MYFNRLFFVLTFFLILSFRPAQQSVVYHEIITGIKEERPIIVTGWNQKKGSRYIRETIDEHNRVVKLDFIRNGRLVESAWLPIAKITYEYDENMIIETVYDENEKALYVDKHSSHYQTIYYLDKNNYIKKVERISDFETRNPIWKELDIAPTSTEELKKESIAFFKQYYKGKPYEIEFYKYSYYKYDGMYPVGKNFIIEKDFTKKFLNSCIEEEIVKGIAKLKKAKSD